MSCKDIAPPQDFLRWLLFQRECAFIQTDKQTREQGRLVKMISVVDMSHVQFSMMDKGYMARLALSAPSGCSLPAACRKSSATVAS